LKSFAVLQERSGRDPAHAPQPNLTVDGAARSLKNKAKAAALSSLGAFPAKRGLAAKGTFTVVSAFSRLVYRIMVEGTEHLPAKGGYVLCPNHETHIDGLWIMMHLPDDHRERFCCMAKREHLDTLVGRMMLRIAGGIPVDRKGNPFPAYKRCLEKLKEGKIVLIHPEGTRTSDGTLGPFKSGASKLGLDSGAPLVPVRIEGGFAVFPKSRKLPRFFDLRNRRRFTVKISFGPPIMPHAHSIDELTRCLREAVANLRS
jgi:1-acyl-sn-glycerol-3-phosphate acyltransferase